MCLALTFVACTFTFFQCIIYVAWFECDIIAFSHKMYVCAYIFACTEPGDPGLGVDEVAMPQPIGQTSVPSSVLRNAELAVCRIVWYV